MPWSVALLSSTTSSVPSRNPNTGTSFITWNSLMRSSRVSPLWRLFSSASTKCGFILNGTRFKASNLEKRVRIHSTCCCVFHAISKRMKCSNFLTASRCLTLVDMWSAYHWLFEWNELQRWIQHSTPYMQCHLLIHASESLQPNLIRTISSAIQTYFRHRCKYNVPILQPPPDQGTYEVLLR